MLRPLVDIRVLQDEAHIRLVTKEGFAYVDKLSSGKKYVLHTNPPQRWIIDAE